MAVGTCKAGDVVARANCWASFDGDFSRALGAAGYIGMTLPSRYGGGDRHPLERYVVIEELLAAGAPVGAHWIADRQTGPLIVRYGSEDQCERYLPGIAKGELYACIGLSEPGAGSDLAAVRTTARETAEGWRINGQKIWTTGAHFSHIMLALVRTEEGSARNAGLSQLLIDLDTPASRSARSSTWRRIMISTRCFSTMSSSRTARWSGRAGKGGNRSPPNWVSNDRGRNAICRATRCSPH
ncbi:acyl-CoA dehydrogenase family protein [Sphingopyxis sp.]|uniref:acyl-CoA dehydrogenase family protein n=1 Tax=Sphingopyxis sp. TaxID=1908224 RepID=UPI002600514E|nr:acyl-CoA dehydrogenase family protein [Sphingopyxis sp.]